MSDQDFFFDEDETVEEAPPAKGESKRSSTSAGKSAARASAPAAAAGTQTVSMTVAALIGVVTLLLGVIIGIFIPAGGTSNLPAPTNNGTQSMPAPELSPEALESGELPPGHPPLDSMGGGTEAPEGMPPVDESAEPTATE